MIAETKLQRQARLAELARIRALAGPELASEVMVLIEGNLERWYQDSWRHNGLPEERYEAFREDPLNPNCKTSFCVAGWVAALDGVRWREGSVEYIGDPRRCNCTGSVCRSDLHVMFVSDYARWRLDLADDEASRLFHGENTLDDLRQMVDALNRPGGSVYDVVLYRDEDDEETYYDEDDDEDEDD